MVVSHLPQRDYTHPPLLLLLVHLLGILLLASVLLWIVYYRHGIALSGDAVFNIHPLLMIGAFIVVSSEATLAFKTISGTKRLKKVVHLTLQGVAILSSFLGLLAALKFHNDNQIPNFYSLHSWLGVLTLILYSFQWVLGFVTFWYPGSMPSVRVEILPWHVFIGLTSYVLALVSAVLGLLEKLTFLQQGAGVVGKWSTEAMLVNWIGIIIFFYGATVVLIATIFNTRKPGAHRASA